MFLIPIKHLLSRNFSGSVRCLPHSTFPTIPQLSLAPFVALWCDLLPQSNKGYKFLHRTTSLNLVALTEVVSA